MGRNEYDAEPAVALAERLVRFGAAVFPWLRTEGDVDELEREAVYRVLCRQLRFALDGMLAEVPAEELYLAVRLMCGEQEGRAGQEERRTAETLERQVVAAVVDYLPDRPGRSVERTVRLYLPADSPMAGRQISATATLAWHDLPPDVRAGIERDASAPLAFKLFGGA